jgi:hypothetical protein
VKAVAIEPTNATVPMIHVHDVGRVASAADHDATLAAGGVAWVEGPPALAEPDLNPRSEVHRRRMRRDVPVGEVAEDVAGGRVR